VQQVFDRSVDEHAEHPQEMLQALQRGLAEITVTEQRDVSYTDKQAADRMKEYGENILPQGWMAGIPTGLSYFDATLRLGYEPGELIGLVARTGIGKSWIIMYQGLIAWMAKKRVLFLSPELPKIEAEARWDTLMCGMSDIKVDALDFYRGFRPNKEQVKMAAGAAERSDWITLCSVDGRPFTIGEIPRLVKRFEPDVVLIDGLNFIQTPARRGQQAWERIMDVSYGLKSVAAGQDVVVMVSHQANRAAAHNLNRPPALHEIAGGDGFSHACDRLLVLHPPKQPAHRLVVTIQKFRRGEPLQGGLHLLFDPGKGLINETFDDPSTARDVRPHGADVQGGEGDARPMSIP
jgi:replicative DNA helicase